MVVRPPPESDHRIDRDGAQQFGYRPDIQGLRAVAVILVVVYHSEVAWSGGFVGVDVFFVISGFVIFRLFLRELRTAPMIDLGAFYSRRVRRIMPAAAVAATATLLGTTLLLSPTGAQEFAAATGVAASVFVSNLYLFASGGGYFDPTEAENPFTHFWSLSVEEQFYLFLPAFSAVVLLATRSRSALTRRHVLVGGLLVVSAVSLWISWRLTSAIGPLGEPTAGRLGFYGPMSRVWEFGAGCLLAALIGRDRLWPTWLRLPGIVLGIGSVVVLAWVATSYDSLTVFPGLAAVVPVAATVGLIVAGTWSGAVSAALAIRPLTWIGDRSYGWYLWHWPFIVFAAVLWPGSERVLLVAALVALVPAHISYRFVETPIRTSPRYLGRGAVRLGLVCTLGPALLGAAVYTGARLDWGLDLPPGLGNDESLARELGCDGSRTSWSEQRCTLEAEGAEERILLLGDSHASAISDSVAAAGRLTDRDVTIWTEPGCALTTGALPNTACREWRQDALAYVAATRPDVVVVSQRSTIYTQTDQYEMNELWQESGPMSDAEALDRWETEIGLVLEELDALDVRVLYVAVVPEFDRYRAPTLVRPLEVPTASIDEVAARRGAVLAVERSLVEAIDGASVVDASPQWCSERECAPVVGGEWIYYDSNHLNGAAADVVAPVLVEQLERTAGD